MPSNPLPVAVQGDGRLVSNETRNETAQRLTLALDAASLGDWDWDAKTDAIKLSPRAIEIWNPTRCGPHALADAGTAARE